MIISVGKHPLLGKGDHKGSPNGPALPHPHLRSILLEANRNVFRSVDASRELFGRIEYQWWTSGVSRPLWFEFSYSSYVDDFSSGSVKGYLKLNLILTFTVAYLLPKYGNLD